MEGKWITKTTIFVPSYTKKLKYLFSSLWKTLIVLVIIAGISLFTCSGIFISEDEAVDTLHDHGFSDIEITDHQIFMVGLRGCSDSDSAKFIANATNPAGKKVTVIVCAGLLKGGTIRSK